MFLDHLIKGCHRKHKDCSNHDNQPIGFKTSFILKLKDKRLSSPEGRMFQCFYLLLCLKQREHESEINRICVYWRGQMSVSRSVYRSSINIRSDWLAVAVRCSLTHYMLQQTNRKWFIAWPHSWPWKQMVDDERIKEQSTETQRQRRADREEEMFYTEFKLDLIY